jgi:hypothetical protein
VTQHALSLKQPWAALLAAGRKTIEVRNWRTPRRGRVLIHAARLSDERPEVWARLPPDLRAAASLVGGIVGEGELLECRVYRTADAFAADAGEHLNDPSWFRLPRLFGFVFGGLRVLPYRRLAGWMRFFPVPDEAPAGP